MLYPAKLLSLRKSSGQAVLLVILGMAAVLTIVLSVVSRSVTDVSVTNVEEGSSKAFSAAEAGIEKLLVGDTSSISNLDLGNNASIQSAQSLVLGEGENSFDFPDTYNSGDLATVWFVSHDDTNIQKLTCTVKPCFNGTSFSIHWNGDVAVEVSVYYDTNGISGVIASTPNFSGVKVKRFTFDPNATRRNNNKFSATIASSQQGYSYSSGDISLSGLTRPLFARVKFLYGSVSGFRVTTPLGGGTLPSQGRLLVSKGAASNATRQIEVRDYYRAPIEVFEAGIFSQGDLTK